MLAPPPAATRVEWIEVAARSDARLLPTSVALIERWVAAGSAVRSRVVTGPAFWQTTEIELAPAMIDASIEALTTASEGDGGAASPSDTP